MVGRGHGSGGRGGRDLDGPDAAAVLRERIYGGIACLSTLLVLSRHLYEDAGHADAWSAVLDVVVATGSLWAASLLADVVAHMAAHGEGPRGAERARVLRTSGQILEASGVPLVLLVLAALHVMSLDAAVRAGIWVSVITLGLFAALAARRTGLPWWKRTMIVAALVGLGALVVAVKTLAHG